MTALMATDGPTHSLKDSHRYRLRLDSEAQGMLRPDSNAARKYCGPLLGPQAIGTYSVMYNLVEENMGLVEPSSRELAGRVGLSEDRLEQTLKRLEGFGLITRSHDTMTGWTDMSVASWIDPPRTTWREAHYPPELQEEFSVFVAAAERARSSQRHLDQPEPVTEAPDSHIELDL